MSYNEIRTDGFDKNNRPPSSDSPLVIGDDIYAVEYNPDNGGSRLRGKGIFGSTNFTPTFWEDGQWTKVGEKRILEKITSEQKGQWETTIKNSLNNAVELTNGKTPPYLATKIEPSNNGGTGEENNGEQNATTEQPEFIAPEFGRVDSILKKLSLRNLKYPIDADYGNTQDYIQINQFKYKAPSKDIFFATDEVKKEKKTNPSNFIDGVPMGTPKSEAIGLVKLPMPNSLADSNNVVWGPDKLNALTAAVASGTLGVTNSFLAGLNDIIQDANNKNIGELAQEAFEKIGTGAGKVKDQALEELQNASNQIANQNTNLNLLARGVFGSTVLNALQFKVSPEALLSRGQGVIPNNNVALLFNSPTLREFTFSWKMSPRSQEEAIRVNNILRFFKQGMAPKKASDSGTQGRSFFLGTPNVFDIHFKTTKRKANFFNSIDRNDSVLRIKTCACTGAAVSYTPEGMWNAYEDGQPVAITLTLRFSELEPIFDTDYDENDLNFDPARPDLLPVPIDAVGY